LAVLVGSGWLGVGGWGLMVGAVLVGGTMLVFFFICA
jgi:hypothetical protein